MQLLVDLFNIFLIVSAIHGFIFSAIMRKSKNGKTSSVLYLTLMTLAISFNNLQSWLLTKKEVFNFSFLDYIQIPWHFLIAPFFFMFVVHYLGVEKRFFNLLKVILPIFFCSIIIQGIYLWYAKETYATEHYSYLYEQYTSIEEAFSFIISFAIYLYSFHIIRNNKDWFHDLLSYDNLKWLRNFLIFAAFIYVLWGFALIIEFYLHFKNFIVFYYPLRIATTVLIYWLGYQTLIFLRQIEERKSIRELSFPETNINTDAHKKFIKIEKYISKNRRFLDNQLSLEILANELQMSSSQLSRIINEETGNNFSFLMNSYRVEFSKQLLTNTTYESYTITSIALEAGFSSKSTFYNVFKKHTGLTPTQFKNNTN
ncbi:AraC family transcriptional regulator [Tenacibaculum sp. 190524A02b]|uniref:AraC family transcriptional regulator n=1 Tax=Tenacibaculum vairaonense TaxID=3137860 RepID=A0ABM9PHC3_9FLAO